MRNFFWLSALIVGWLGCGSHLGNAEPPSLPPRLPDAVVSVRHVRELENPFQDPAAGGNSHLLPGSEHNRRNGPPMSPEGPCFAVTWARDYENCTVAFYNARLEMIATWREPVANGDKVMTVTAGDLNADGVNEIVLTTRKKAPGAYALRWNSRTRQLESIWSFTAVKQGPYYRGIEVGNFTNHPGREVCFGGDGAGLYLLDQNGRLIAHSDEPPKTIQRIDVCDLDGDGLDELIIATGRDPGMVYLGRWQPAGDSFQIIWRANVTPDGRGGNNCFEALYHPRGNPAGGGAIAVATEQEAPLETRTGALLLLDLNGRELWRYPYAADDERGGACGFADITGDEAPEIISRFSRSLPEPPALGVLILNNHGNLLAKIPEVTASSAGPYIFRPNATTIYVLATTNVYAVEFAGQKSE